MIEEKETFVGTATSSTGVNQVQKGKRFLLKDVNGKGTHYYVYTLTEEREFMGIFTEDWFYDLQEVDEMEIIQFQKLENEEAFEQLVLF